IRYRNVTGVQTCALPISVWLISTLVSGWVADKIGRRRIMALGWFVQAAGIIPLFELVKNFGVMGVLLGTSLLAVGLGMTYGPQAVWYADLFPASVRYSGVSISYALGAIFGGAFAPTIAEMLMEGFGTTWAIVMYLLSMAALGLLRTFMLKETANIGIDYEFDTNGGTGQWDRGTKPLSECLATDDMQQPAAAASAASPTRA